MQPPTPSHFPFRPQVDTLSSGQSPLDGLPSGTGEQLPGVPPGTLHEVQMSAHGPLQQTPSTQNPLMQCAAESQVVPWGIFETHKPAEQYCASGQGSVAQDLMHKTPLQA